MSAYQNTNFAYQGTGLFAYQTVVEVLPEALPHGVPVKLWRELWKRPPMAFRAHVVASLDVMVSVLATYHPAKKKNRPPAIPKPLFTERDRLELKQAVVAKLAREQEEVRRTELARAVRLAVQRQIEDEEEIYSLALMLLD